MRDAIGNHISTLRAGLNGPNGPMSGSSATRARRASVAPIHPRRSIAWPG